MGEISYEAPCVIDLGSVAELTSRYLCWYRRHGSQCFRIRRVRRAALPVSQKQDSPLKPPSRGFFVFQGLVG